MSKKKHYKSFYVIINIESFDIRLTPTKSTLTTITGMSPTTAAKITSRTTHNNFIVFPVTEE